jgi:arsenate reductase
MAEGFARRYGADVMEVGSAGLSPASIVQLLTKKVMAEKGIDIEEHFPKDLGNVGVLGYDLLINMSGVKLPGRVPIEVREWKVIDPIGQSEEFYREVRDQIEDQVMRLILELRRDARIEVGEQPVGRFTRLGRRPR